MRILIIEDDEFFQKFYSSKLKEAGFEVYTASDGEEGLRLAKVIVPQLIVLDIIMPGKDGFEVLQILSQDKSLSMIPVIVFSTLGQAQDIEKAKKLGARDYIDKSSFDFNSLKAKITSLLQKP